MTDSIPQDDSAAEGGPVPPADILHRLGTPFSSFSHAPIRTLADIERELALPPELLLKTMAFRAADSRFVLAALPVLSRVHYGRLAAAVGVARAGLRQAEESGLSELGMQPGGVSPLTTVPGTLVVFDGSVAAMETVYCGSGRVDVTIKIAASDLVLASAGEFAEIGR